MRRQNFFQRQGQKINGEFIKGPIPVGYLTECFRIGPNAGKIGLALLYLRERRKSDTVKLTGGTRSLFLISPWTVSQKLKTMEEKGLVKVEEIRRGVAPVVTLLLDQYYESVGNADSD